MKIKQLTEILNVDVRRIARQEFKKDLNVFSVKVGFLENGGYRVFVEFEDIWDNNDGWIPAILNFEYDCHGHLINYDDRDDNRILCRD